MREFNLILTIDLCILWRNISGVEILIHAGDEADSTIVLKLMESWLKEQQTIRSIEVMLRHELQSWSRTIWICWQPYRDILPIVIIDNISFQIRSIKDIDELSIGTHK